MKSIDEHLHRVLISENHPYDRLFIREVLEESIFSFQYCNKEN